MKDGLPGGRDARKGRRLQAERLDDRLGLNHELFEPRLCVSRRRDRGVRGTSSSRSSTIFPTQ